MIQLQGISKQYGTKVLFRESSVFIGARARLALVGPNGAGKSTLFKLLLGDELSDTGKIIQSKHLRMGHLAQEVPRFEGTSVLAEVTRLEPKDQAHLEEKRALEEDFEKGLETTEKLVRYGDLLQELGHFDEATREASAKAILLGMGFKVTDFERPLTDFSGGWLMRVAFSRMLLLEPDLLLLDEPTNHLDLESLLWLENFLADFRGSLLIVSHDSAFLNKLVTEVIEIDNKHLYQYAGNLESAKEQKAMRLTRLKAEHAAQQSKIRELEDFIARNRANAATARQAQARVKQLEKIERIEVPEERSQIRFRFPPSVPSGKDVIRCREMGFSYGAVKLYDKVHWTLTRGARVAITGVNGAGKTTLLRLIAGNLQPTEGSLELGHQVVLGYYAQHQADTLAADSTIFEILQETAPHLETAVLRGIAGAFLFSGDSVYKRISVLSGGEKARVALAKLLLSPVNTLVLDEPTNHLDVDSREVLMQALKDYPGTILLVSHDRDFVGPIIESVLEVRKRPDGASELTEWLGHYEDYIRSKEEAALATDAPTKEKKQATRTPQKVTPKKVVTLSDLEAELDEAMQSKEAIEQKLAREPQLQHSPQGIEMLKQLKSLDDLIQELEAKWDALAD